LFHHSIQLGKALLHSWGKITENSDICHPDGSKKTWAALLIAMKLLSLSTLKSSII
jgi:hypothetical protein